jgi:TonB family protein
MYFDFEDYRPDVPRVPSVMSRREAVLLSLVAHALVLLFILFAPDQWFDSPPRETLQAETNEPVRFVQMMPMIDRRELARRLAEQSDLDRRSATRERPRIAENAAPFSRGNTPEKVVGGAEARTAGPDVPKPPSPDRPSEPDPATSLPLDTPPTSRGMARGNLGDAFRNLQRYLQDQNYDNQRGGNTEPSADIQFDAKGVDFGPWLRRFVAQIKRNWLIPQVAEISRGRVVTQFAVLRNGMIVELRVVKPAGIDALTISALNALKLSNPTAALPPEYPDDRAQFTVTFHYNEGPRDVP